MRNKTPFSHLRRGFFADQAATEKSYTYGQKRRFGAAGVLNVLFTNLILQGLLSIDIVGVAVATLISQAINTSIGYAIYGKMVFRIRRLRHHNPLLRYLLLMGCLWLLNLAGIKLGTYIGINRNLVAALLIPCLAMVSFATQKHFVFKQ